MALKLQKLETHMSYWALLLLELIDIVFIHQAIRFIEITIAYEGPQTSKTSNRSGGVKQRNTTPAMTEQEAKALRGSGYHGTRPKSSAEDTELAAAMNKCRKCGMHTTNGKNSLCDACLYNKNHGLD